jgi:hypothetical protein
VRPIDSAEPKGICHGFGLVSDLEFAYLRDGSGERLTVAEVEPPPPPLSAPLLEWYRTDPHPFAARLYGRLGGPYQLWIEPDEWYVIDPEARFIGVPITSDVLRREQRVWGLPSLLMFLAEGDLPLHAAAVDVGDAAVLLAGPSRHGKTSLSLGFGMRGHRVLSDDLVRIRTTPVPTVFPGPAGLRVRSDMTGPAAAQDLRRIGGDEDRDFVAIDPGLRGSGDPLPIAGIVLLKGEADTVRLEAAQPHQATQDLWFLSLNLPTPESRAAKLGHLSTLTDDVPAFDLSRPFLIEALGATVDAIVAEVRSA